MTERLSLPIIAVTDMRAATLASEFIVTSTTAREPFLGPEDIRPGTFIAAVGADNAEKSELSPELMRRPSVFVDVREQCFLLVRQIARRTEEDKRIRIFRHSHRMTFPFRTRVSASLASSPSERPSAIAESGSYRDDRTAGTPLYSAKDPRPARFARRQCAMHRRAVPAMSRSLEATTLRRRAAAAPSRAPRSRARPADRSVRALLRDP